MRECPSCGGPEIIRFGPVRCPHAYNLRVTLDFCQRMCKLIGAAGCPRSRTLGEIIRRESDEMEGEKIGARVAAE